MFDPQFRLSPDLLDTNKPTSDDISSNGPWAQMSLDRLLEHHDITPAQPISIENTNNNDFWSSSAQFNEFFNNYHQQYQQQNQPIDISSFLSSSPPQQQPQQQQKISSSFVDNYIFEPQSDSKPFFLDPYLLDNNRMSIRRDGIPPSQQHSQPYGNHTRQQYDRIPPLLQIPNDDYYQQQNVISPPRHKPTQPPAYIACLNHGVNYNGVSGPPILLPPSF